MTLPQDACLRWSACRIAEELRKGNLRSGDIVAAAIGALNNAASLRAVVTHRFQAALEEAAIADQRIAAARAAGKAALDELPPFLGVPILLKETYEYPSMPYTNGLVSRQGILGVKKGPAVRRIENAGFIVVGFGNLSEACMWMESYNLVYGRACSPYGRHLTPGGSSGGTAAGVAALGAPLGITADIGGSTRIPALYCGLFGHKPTGGTAPNTGTHLDNFDAAVCRICQPGLVARHCEDLLPVVKILAGPPDPEDHDPMAAEYLPSPRWLGHEVDFRRLKVVPLTFRGGWTGLAGALISTVSKPQLAAQTEVVEWLRGQGCLVEPMFFEDLRIDEWFVSWSARIQAAGGPSFRKVICQSNHTFGAGELFRYFAGFSPHTAPALGLAYLEDIFPMLGPPLPDRLERAQAVQDLLTSAVGDYGVFVMPTLPRHGCRHDELLLCFLDSCFTSIWNAVEFPSTAIPLGLHNGGPVGAQIISTRGQDELTLSVAMALAQAGIARCVAPGEG